MRRIPTKRGAAAIFLLLLGIYLLTASGHRYATDEAQMYGLTQALGSYGSLAVNIAEADEEPVYSTYGVGQPAIALPLYWLGGTVSSLISPEARPWLTSAVTFWLNPLVTAAVGALVYVGGRQIGGHRAAVFAALTYGLATIAWPHSKTFFAEPLNTLLWLAAVLLIRPDPAQPHRISNSRFVLAGLMVGLAPLVKIQAAIVLPIIGLYTLWVAQRHGRLWRAGAAWVIGAAIPLLLLAIYNTILFGSPLRTGYGGSILNYFTAPFWEGFGGQLWSIERGLIWYSPLLLLTPLGMVRLWRNERSFTLLCAAIFLSQVLFYAKWYAWDGAGAWGPRFLNVTLPFLCIPLAAIGWNRPLRIVALLLAVLTLPAQIGGLAVNMNRVFLADSPHPSQIVAHLALVAQGAQRAYERHLAAERVILESGWSYSEGTGNALLPRWSRPDAVLQVRSAKPIQVAVAFNSCYVPNNPLETIFYVNNTPIATTSPCPERTYRLLLPSGSTDIQIISEGWNPRSAGIERDERLGVYVSAISASAGGTSLMLIGDRFPVDLIPLERRPMVRHLSDPRVDTWDVWWALLPLMPLAQRDALLIGSIWGGLSMIALGSGVMLLRHRMNN